MCAKLLKTGNKNEKTRLLQEGYGMHSRKNVFYNKWGFLSKCGGKSGIRHDKSRDHATIGHRNIFKLWKDKSYNTVEYGELI